MRINGRYEIREKIGEGGMGIVYRAEDIKLRSEVALKTLRNPLDDSAFEAFKKECQFLSNLDHVNIVGIRDVDQYDDGGISRPYLVMPLLRGVTLDKIIEKQPNRLTPERVVKMITDVCHGLEAAHQNRVIHRDLKPSNLFVSADDSVRIIDFGISQLLDDFTTRGGKGTPYYMSPEQIRMEKLTPESDIFSLGVICFECLTRRRPFSESSSKRGDISESILKFQPAPVSAFNPAVSPLLSQVIQAAMAKNPRHRYRSATEFAECLQSGLRNEPIERFDAEKIAPRLEQIHRLLESSEYDDARDLLGALEAEGYLHPEMPSIKKQIETALRNRRISQLLDSARRLFASQEYGLVLEKLQQILDEDPKHAEALKLRDAAQEKRREEQYGRWLRIAEEHLQNYSFAQARQAAERAREIDATDIVIQLLTEIENSEREYQAIRNEKEQLYRSAVEYRSRGELTHAVEKVERLISLHNRIPDKTSPDRGITFEKLFKEIKIERDAVETGISDARRYLANREYEPGLATCNHFLVKYPGHLVFKDLLLQITERQQQDLSEFIAKVDREATADPDLDRRVAMYEQALERYPTEPHFQRALHNARERRDNINEHVRSARNKEERGQYTEALNQWETLRELYPRYPGLGFEIERIRVLRDEKARQDERATMIHEIQRYLESDDLSAAVKRSRAAVDEYPNDPEVRALADVAQNRLEKAAQVSRQLETAKSFISDGDYDAGIAELRKTLDLGERQALTRARLVDALVSYSRLWVDRDAEKSLQLAREAATLDEFSAKARDQVNFVLQRLRTSDVARTLDHAQSLQEIGAREEGLRLLDAALEKYPQEPRLIQYRESLCEADFETAKHLYRNLSQTNIGDEFDSIFDQLRTVATRHHGDPRFSDLQAKASLDREQRNWALPGQNAPPSTVERPQSGPTPAPDLKPSFLESLKRVQRKYAENWRTGSELLRPRTKAIFLAIPLRLNRSGRLLLLTGLGLVTLGAVVFLAILSLRSNSAATGSVEFQIGPAAANPGVTYAGPKAGAASGSQTVQLPPGPYSISAVAKGYKPLTESVTVRAGALIKVSRQLEPIPAPPILRPTIEMNSDLRAGSLSLDGQSSIALTDGDLSTSNSVEVMPGNHTVRIFDGHNQVFSFDFQYRMNTIVSLTSSPKGIVPGVVVCSLNGDALIYANGNARAARAGDPLKPIPAEGMRLVPTNGNFDLQFEGSRLEHFAIPNSSQPVVSVRLSGNQYLSFLVTANVPDPRVLINGKSPRLMSNGRCVVKVRPGTYTVTVAKDGYQSPAEQTININGTTPPQTLNFDLKPLITKAYVLIEGAPPDTEVILDGKSQGSVDETGGFKKEMEPGPHTVLLHKQYYEDTSQYHVLKAGDTIRLDGRSMTQWGTFKFNIAPEDAKPRIEFRGRRSAQASNNEAVHLPPGNYTVNVVADGYKPQTDISIDVRPGESSSMNLALSPMIKPPGKVTPDQVFENGSSWTEGEGHWWVHRDDSNSFLLDSYRRAHNDNLVFEILSPQGSAQFFSSRKVTFLAEYLGKANYIQYTWEHNRLTRSVINKGKATLRQAFNVDSKVTVFRIRVVITSRTIAIENGSGAILDSIERSGPNGKFGFAGKVALVPR